MMKRLVTIILLLLFVQTSQSAKYSGDAFSLGVGSRALALGGAVVAGPFDGTAAYWNPAGMNYLDGRYITAMHAETFGSLLNHDFIAYVNSKPGSSSRIRAYGFYLYYLGGGGIKITQLDQFNRPYVIREESHGDYLLAGSISGKLTDKIDFGLSAKIIYRDIGTETGKGLTVDAGFYSKISESFSAGLMLSDITTGFIRYSKNTFGGDAATESIYPTVKPGLMYIRSISEFTGRLLFSADIKFENLQSASQYWGGSMSVDTHYGLELSYKEMLFGRGGFDIGRFTVGGGVDIKNITIDFAYLHHDELDETYRVSAGYRF